MSDITENYDQLKLSNQLCFPLYATARLVTKAYAPVLADFGLTYLQYLILMVLWEDDEQSVKLIGEKLFLDSGTLTPVLKKMEQASIIKRIRSDVDDRIVLNKLSEKGQKLKIDLQNVPAQLFCQSKLELEEAEQIMNSLKLLLDRVKDISEN